MATRIDLDQAALEIARRAEAWRANGLVVEAPTWRDIGEPWPYPLKVNRTDVKHADSLGVAVRKDTQEGSVVLFDGGWADLLYWDGTTDKLVDEAPGWDDWLNIEAFANLLDRFARMFT